MEMERRKDIGKGENQKDINKEMQKGKMKNKRGHQKWEKNQKGNGNGKGKGKNENEIGEGF